MKFCISMITIDRGMVGRKNYLGETMESFLASGLWDSSVEFEFHLFDGGSEDRQYIRPWANMFNKIHYPTYRIAPKINAGRAMMIGADTDCDWVIFCEDDITVCKNFLKGAAAWLEKYAAEQYRVVALYCPYMEVTWNQEQGEPYWEYPVQSFYGTQCIAVRRGDAERIGHYVLSEKNFEQAGQGYDLIMKAWHKETYPDLQVLQASVPSFVQHIGEDSFINPGRFHACKSFPGNDWDALSL